jgi:hypothetical protein
MYDPNQKSRSSTKMWPCTHVWPKPKIKIKNKNVILYTCMTLTKNQGQVQKYDLVLYLTLIFGLGHTSVQGHIFVLDLDFWLGSYMCTRSHFCSWSWFLVWVIHVYKVILHMYDPYQKSRSSTKIWPCTHVWPKPKIKDKNKNVTLYTFMTQTKNHGQIQKYDNSYRQKRNKGR